MVFCATGQFPRFGVRQVQLRLAAGGGAGFVQQPAQGLVARVQDQILKVAGRTRVMHGTESQDIQRTMLGRIPNLQQFGGFGGRAQYGETILGADPLWKVHQAAAVTKDFTLDQVL